MGFDVYAAGQSEGKESKVDFDAMNKYVVETAQLQNREVLVGYISGIVDLGLQAQEDAEVVFTGSAEDEAAEIAKNPNTYFKDGIDQQTKRPARLKCWPVKPAQSVAIAVDFPDILIDKGQFFGESKPLPLRMWLGGQFFLDGSMVIGRPIPLKVTNIAEEGQPKVWSFAKNHSLYKMAVGAKIVDPGKPFLPKDIDSLLGVSLQFSVQIYMKAGKGGKEYYTEYIQFSSGLGRGQKPCEIVTKPFVVQFNQKNNEEDLNNLRSHVVNTIRRASNYEGSVLQGELDALKPIKARQDVPEGDDSAAEEEFSQEPPKPTPAPKRKATPAPAKAGDFEDDAPY